MWSKGWPPIVTPRLVMCVKSDAPRPTGMMHLGEEHLLGRPGRRPPLPRAAAASATARPRTAPDTAAATRQTGSWPATRDLSPTALAPLPRPPRTDPPVSATPAARRRSRWEALPLAILPCRFLVHVRPHRRGLERLSGLQQRAQTTNLPIRAKHGDPPSVRRIAMKNHRVGGES